MTGVHPMEYPFYYVCLVILMFAWAGFSLAFVVFKPKTPPAADAPAVPAAAPAPKTRDRRSLLGIGLQSVGYFLMWLSFRPPFPTLSLVPGPLAIVLALFAVALAWLSSGFAFWALRTLGKEWSFEARLVEGHRLVTTGPYAIVRHPIYSAMCGLWLASGIAVARPWGLVLGIVPMVLGTWIRVKLEDGLLRGAFGETFEAWAKRVPAVVPGLQGLGLLGIVLAGCTAAASPARGAAAPALAKCATQDEWTRYDTDHFTLYSNAAADAGALGAKRLETFAWMLGQRSPGLEDFGGIRVIVYGFASKGDYDPFCPQFHGRRIKSVGMSLAGPRGKYFMFSQAGNAEEERTIYHEYLHSLVSDRIGQAPPCVNEGLADFFSTFALVGDVANFGDPIPDYCWILQHETPMPMDVLFGIGHDRDYFEGEKRDLMYAESWALVHYLIRNASSDTFEHFAMALDAGTPAHDAFALAYPSEDWSGLHNRLRAYADEGEMDHFHVPIGASFTGANIESRPATRPEVLTALGDLLLQEERSGSAEAPAYYQAALVLKPEDPAALRGLAEVNEARKFAREADGMFRRSASASGADATTLGQCAAGMLRVAGRDSIGAAGRDSARAASFTRARAVAVRALELDATEPRALDVVCAGVDDDSAFAARSIGLLELSHAHFPNRTSVTGGLVRAYARVGRLDAAQALLADDAPLGADVGEKRRARDAIDQAGVREARDLARAGRTAEAAEILRGLQATNRRPEFAKFLDEQLRRLTEHEVSNQWVDRYNSAVAEANAGHVEQARAIFQDVHDHSPDAGLALEAGKHAKELRDYQAKMGAHKAH